jgi:hypothetical protein
MTKLGVGALVGTWTNTETRWQWIRRVDIREDGGSLMVRMHGGAEASPRQWGPEEIEALYAASAGDTEAAGFRALFDHGSMRSEVQATLNQGLMVLVSFNDAVDGRAGVSAGGDASRVPGRRDAAGPAGVDAAATALVTREFFAREGGAA